MAVILSPEGPESFSFALLKRVVQYTRIESNRLIFRRLVLETVDSLDT